MHTRDVDGMGSDKVGVTTVVTAGRITSCHGPKVVSHALNYDGAAFLAKCLAIATGGPVHVTFTNSDGGDDFRANPDDFPEFDPSRALVLLDE